MPFIPLTVVSLVAASVYSYLTGDESKHVRMLTYCPHQPLPVLASSLPPFLPIPTHIRI